MIFFTEEQLLKIIASQSEALIKKDSLIDSYFEENMRLETENKKLREENKELLNRTTVKEVTKTDE
jgi:regulator of replication initiation timing